MGRACECAPSVFITNKGTIMAKGTSRPARTDAAEKSATTDAVPSITLYTEDSQFDAPVRSRDGKVFISGRLHDDFSKLKIALDKRVDEITGNLKHVVHVLSLTDEDARAEYMASHATDIANDVIALGARVNAKNFRTVEQAMIEKRFVYDVAQLIIDRKALTEDQVALVDSDVAGSFWAEQNLEALKELVDWFRGRMGF